MNATLTDLLVQIAPLMIIQIIWASVIAIYQAKQQRGAVLSFVLCVIPVIGGFFIFYFNVVTTMRVLDRLNAIESRQAN